MEPRRRQKEPLHCVMTCYAWTIDWALLFLVADITVQGSLVTIHCPGGLGAKMCKTR